MRRTILPLLTALAALLTFPLWIAPLALWALLHWIFPRLILPRASRMRRIRLLSPRVRTDALPEEISLAWGVEEEALREHTRGTRVAITLAIGVAGTAFIFLGVDQLLGIYAIFPWAPWVGVAAFVSLLHLLGENLGLSQWRVIALRASEGHNARAVGLSGLREAQEQYRHRTGQEPPSEEMLLQQYLDAEWERAPDEVYMQPGRTLGLVLQRYLENLLFLTQQEVARRRRAVAVKVKTVSGERSWWEVLGVAEQVSEEDAKKAYRARAKRYHPDRFTNPAEHETAQRRMQEISEAWAIARQERAWR